MNTAPGNPSDIARETIRRLATRRIPPTPDQYAKIYREVSGGGIVEAPRKERPAEADWPGTLRSLLEQWDTRHAGLTRARKREHLDFVLDRNKSDPARLLEGIRGMVRNWSMGSTASGSASMDGPEVEPAGDSGAAAPPSVSAGSVEGGAPVEVRPEGAMRTEAATQGPAATVAAEREAMRATRELLAQTLTLGVADRLGYTPDLAEDAKAIAERLRAPNDAASLAQIGVDLRDLFVRIELQGASITEVNRGLLLLMQMLLENIAELACDDRWLKGQVEGLRKLINGRVDTHSIALAERGLRDVVLKQGTLKNSLEQAKNALKSMVATFIDRLGSITDHTGDFQERLEQHAVRIQESNDLAQIEGILQDLLADTRGAQADMVRTHEELKETRRRAEEAQVRVRALESELVEIGSRIREDPLTRTLNRRGLDEVYEVESARCDRSGRPLSIAVIDLDDFKRLNDRLGHQAGDYALVHLSRAVREEIRPTDMIARYGGEEFVIVLPETEASEAVKVIERVRKKLAARAFRHEGETVQITFSAGVAGRLSGEEFSPVMDRADKALYRAKRAGKDRVLEAV